MPRLVLVSPLRPTSGHVASGQHPAGRALLLAGVFQTLKEILNSVFSGIHCSIGSMNSRKSAEFGFGLGNWVSAIRQGPLSGPSAAHHTVNSTRSTRGASPAVRAAETLNWNASPR